MNLENIVLPEGLKLIYDNDFLTLTDGELKLSADLTNMIHRLKPNNLNGEMIVKAAKIKNSARGLSLLDATAGMGEDSLLLAAAGFNVTLYEYDPVIGALLEDALLRAKEIPELSEAARRMTLYKEDSINAMMNLESSPDVILLDPMFPERKKSGHIKKKFQLLQQLESPCTDEKEMLNAAIHAAPRKIVVKRPCKGPFLADQKPDYSIKGNAIRYDCFVFTGK